MPRARLLKPGFFKNVTLAQLSERHRLLYAGLWTLADKEGRLKDEPVWIKAELFPYESEVDVDRLLSDLQHAGFILRYAYGDTSRARKARDRFRAIAIPAFSRHQTPHHREPASLIPAPTSKRSHPISPPPSHAHDSPRPALGEPESSRTVIDPVPVTGDPVPDPVSKTKSSAAGASRISRNGNGKTDDLPTHNIGIITKIAHEVIDLLGPDAPDLPDTVKGLCASRHIAYDSATVNRAIDSAIHQRTHRHAAGGN
jgi:hypothetical protein